MNNDELFSSSPAHAKRGGGLKEACRIIRKLPKLYNGYFICHCKTFEHCFLDVVFYFDARHIPLCMESNDIHIGRMYIATIQWFRFRQKPKICPSHG